MSSYQRMPGSPPHRSAPPRSHGSTSSPRVADLDQRGVLLLMCCPDSVPNINEIQTKTFPNLGPSLLSTSLETGKRGACTNMPRKPQTLNSLRGIDIKYSWKKADVANTMSVAVVLELPAETRGLYRCLTHHLNVSCHPSINAFPFNLSPVYR